MFSHPVVYVQILVEMTWVVVYQNYLCFLHHILTSPELGEFRVGSENDLKTADDAAKECAKQEGFVLAQVRDVEELDALRYFFFSFHYSVIYCVLNLIFVRCVSGIYKNLEIGEWEGTNVWQ